ncbi:hypothetical protein Xmau_03032 [Xenorhabdus mauleonii]|uniref:Uncharacterized protein n=1 Tax=Xenorhabdus mauleonii TaxID=351675 RepID=A0A1I3SF18_9GAMM|nr:hypothetical protein [Xenorhabdus mauleonii]PHM39127.1 hypothetical protein Xmau_03032 [Xenorhabdus mauleonii]SFJ56151.1 hypothetical protein SAMN05421680_11153 [Xenorhabdus mauleonii]
MSIHQQPTPKTREIAVLIDAECAEYDELISIIEARDQEIAQLKLRVNELVGCLLSGTLNMVRQICASMARSENSQPSVFEKHGRKIG